MREVARIGEIASVRLAREDILGLHEAAEVDSLKAPRHVCRDLDELQEVISVESWSGGERNPGWGRDGQGVVVAVLDWGVDFTHQNFLTREGSTRLLALWDQRGEYDEDHPNRYERGRIFARASIDEALATDDPYVALGYHPGRAAPDGASHGTHVLDIAAGRPVVGPGGVAPGADLVFVEMGPSMNNALANFGDEVTIVEAIHFVLDVAGTRPVVINMSMGRQAGPHDGYTLVEMALDAAISSRPGVIVINSAGNYRDRAAHTSGQLVAGERRELWWRTMPGDETLNELEVWYSGADRLRLSLVEPEGRVHGPWELDERGDLEVEGELVGRAYHRASDPNNGDHHIDLFLFPNAPAGRWAVVLEAVEISVGRYDAWIERDAAGRHQSRFDVDADPSVTTGTIANGHHSIAVGAFDPRSAVLAPFSSSGPTRDGRTKPELVAPGVGQLAAASVDIDGYERLLVRKSGTSMAAPHVTGTVALLLEAEPTLSVERVRNILRGSTNRFAGPGEATGWGEVNPARALADLERVSGPARSNEFVMQTINESVQVPHWFENEAEPASEVIALDAEDVLDPLTSEVVGPLPPPSTRVSLEAVRYLTFEGGGGKGLALLGAVEALASARLGTKLRYQGGRLDPRGDIKGISGASAGALMAVALASGYTPAELRTMMVPGGRGAENFNQFFDLPSRIAKRPRVGHGCEDSPEASENLVRWVRQWVLPSLNLLNSSSVVGSALSGLGVNPVEHILQHLLDRWTVVDTRMHGSGMVPKLVRHPILYGIRNLQTDYGLFSGCYARDFFDRIISTKAAVVRGGSARNFRNMTFRQHQEVFGVKLVLTGTNVERESSELFSADSTPNFPVADAARISMSIPFLFKPVMIHSAQGIGNGGRTGGRLVSDAELVGTWIDGGILNNLPIRAFDHEPGANPKTFGIRVELASTGRNRIDSLIEFAARYVALVASGTGETHNSSSNALRGRSVTLDSEGLSTTDFRPNPNVLRSRVRDAELATYAYFNR